MNYILKIKKFLMFFIPILLFIFCWEILSQINIVNPLLFPPPSQVFGAFLEWLKSGELLSDIQSSYYRMILGFLLGGSTGIIIGLLTGRINSIDLFLNPLLQLFRPLPPVAIIPLIIVWLGIGDTAKIFSISFAVFFPVWINTHLGSSSIPKNYIWSAQILSKNKLKILLRVILPATLPFIIAGLRTSIALSFIMVYVSEIAGASSGIGYRISVMHLAYRIDKMMAALVVLAIAGALADLFFVFFVKRIIPWYKNME